MSPIEPMRTPDRALMTLRAGLRTETRENVPVHSSGSRPLARFELIIEAA
jgi:hypothetical protein